MGWLKKLKKALHRVDQSLTGGRVTRELNNAGKAVAPLAKPVLTVLGAVVAGPAGAAAGAAIGEPTGNVLATGKLESPPQRVDLDLTLHVVGAPDGANLSGGSLSEYDLRAGGAVSTVSGGAGSGAVVPAGLTTQVPDVEPSWAELFAELLGDMEANALGGGWHLDAAPPPAPSNAATSVTGPGAPLSIAPTDVKYTVNQHGIAVMDGYAYAPAVSGFKPDGTPVLDRSAIKRKIR